MPDPVKPLTEEELLAVTAALGPGYKFPSCFCRDCHARYRTVLEAVPRLLATAREAAELRALVETVRGMADESRRQPTRTGLGLAFGNTLHRIVKTIDELKGKPDA